MARVILQAGHSAEFPPYKPGGGGAPGEAEWTANLARKLKMYLLAAGVQSVEIVGSWYSTINGQRIISAPAPAMNVDADLFVALHYDADIYDDHTGCFADVWAADSDVTPTAIRSAQALAAFERIYPRETGIPLRNNRRNPNTSYYYGFASKTKRTPGLLIEHGVGQGLDHAVLFGRIDKVAEADAGVILSYLNLPFTPTPTTPEGDTMPTLEQQLILDAVARVNWTPADIDRAPGLIATLREQLSGQTYNLSQAHQEVADRDTLIAAQKNDISRLSQELADARAALATDPVPPSSDGLLELVQSIHRMTEGFG